MASSASPSATAGYYQASLGLRVFRMVLGTAERLSHRLAVRASVRLFLTPLPFKWLQRRGRWSADWRVEPWSFEGTRLTVYSQPAAPHGPVALLVHGWGGHAHQMQPLAETLALHGFRPVVLEMPGHGRSPGLASSLPQFTRAIEYVAHRLQQEGHQVRLLAAHSMGASAAAHAASRGLGIGKLVLLAPPGSPRAFTREFAHVFGLSEATRAAMQRRIEAREGMLMQQFDAGALAPRLQLPTLVVHDKSDRVNAFADGQSFAHGVRGAELLATEGLGHRRILKDAEVLGKVVLFAR